LLFELISLLKILKSLSAFRGNDPAAVFSIPGVRHNQITSDPFPPSPASMNPTMSPNYIPFRTLSTSNLPSDLESSLYNRKAPALRAVAWAQNRNFSEPPPTYGPVMPNPITRMTGSPLLEEPTQSPIADGICSATGWKYSANLTKFLNMKYFLFLLTFILIGTLIHIQNLDRQIDEIKQYNLFITSNQEALRLKNEEVLARMRNDTSSKHKMEIDILKRIHELELDK
jgi:hypothetical protein